MLSNTVGTLVAFVSIMLMLSLIITSLVQVTQATLRLRGRNLLVGIGALIEKHAPNEKVESVSRSALRWNPHAAIAAHVLNEADAPAKYLKDPNSWGRVFMGPPVSWVSPDDLARALVKTANKQSAGAPDAATTIGKAASTSLANAALAARPPHLQPPGGQATPAPAATVDSQAAIAEAFKNMEPAISKRFQFIVRLWTVAYSFLIAFIFQLSAPDLLKQLPAADAKRQAILAAVPNLTSEARADAALAETTRLIDQLDAFGIAPKLDNFDFYSTRMASPKTASGQAGWARAIHWSNILGVLITGILLSLGAPFWFEQLKNLSSLRDAMNPGATAKPA